MSADVVTAALDRLRLEFPGLASVTPRFEANARRAVARLGLPALHKKRISLFTALDALDFGRNRAILSALDRQVSMLRGTPNVEGVFGRLSECERGTLLATISELTLAVHLQGLGAEIAFAAAYRLVSATEDASRDVDILARWPWGAVGLEVYSPTHELHNTRDGFIGVRPEGLGAQILKKIHHKFGDGSAQCQGLPPGTLKVLALDLTYNDAALVSLSLHMGQLEAELKSMSGLGGADAVLVFLHQQGASGHPVNVVGILRPSAACGPLFRSLSLARPHQMNRHGVAGSVAELRVVESRSDDAG